jgi:HSP20 family protein
MLRFRAPLRSPFQWDPWHEIDDFRRAFERLGRPVGRMPAPAIGSGFIPEADVHDTGAAFVVSVDLPGVREADLDITVDGSMLTIRGQRDAGGLRDNGCLYCERPAGHFARTIELPESVNVDGIEATLKLGVLEITLAKSKIAAGKRVVVTVGERR